MNGRDPARFAELTYEGFAELARDVSLSKYEKIGFPDSYRAGYEEAIFADIRAKLPRLEGEGGTVLDIGPGCSDLPRFLVELCRARGHRLVLVDSPEMLAHLPDETFITKVPGPFPGCRRMLEASAGKIDVILCYSVLQYVFADTSVFDFLDLSLTLLHHGGEMLIGDIPNVSKRRRFFSSPAGAAFHRRFSGRDEEPEVAFNTVVPRQIDDTVVVALLARARAAGTDAYVLPQPPTLPMSNRREDILLRKP